MPAFVVTPSGGLNHPMVIDVDVNPKLINPMRLMRDVSCRPNPYRNKLSVMWLVLSGRAISDGGMLFRKGIGDGD